MITVDWIYLRYDSVRLKAKRDSFAFTYIPIHEFLFI